MKTYKQICQEIFDLFQRHKIWVEKTDCYSKEFVSLLYLIHYQEITTITCQICNTVIENPENKNFVVCPKCRQDLDKNGEPIDIGD